MMSLCLQLRQHHVLAARNDTNTTAIQESAVPLVGLIMGGFSLGLVICMLLGAYGMNRLDRQRLPPQA